jgi:ATP-binding cassette subfamily C protein
MKRFINKNLFYLALAILTAIICAGLEGFLSIFMMKSIDAATQGNRDLFNQEVIKLIIIALFLIPATIFLSYSSGIYKRKAVVSEKYNYIKKVFNKNINEFQGDNNSRYLSVLTNDINNIENSYIDGLYEVSRYLVNFIVGIIIIGVVSPMALGIGVGIGILGILISILLGKPVEKHLAQRSELYEKYTAYIKEVLGAFHSNHWIL